MTTHEPHPPRWVTRTANGVTYIGSVDWMRYFVCRDGRAVAKTGKALIEGECDPAVWRAFWSGEES